MNRCRHAWSPWLVLLVVGVLGRPAFAQKGDVTRADVERAIKEGVRFLKNEQKADGSWTEVEGKAKAGTTSLVTLALLTAGEPVTEPHIAKALDYLQRMTADEMNSVYSVGLQTMVFAAADPKRYQLRIAANAAWLERAQLKPGDAHRWPGSWSYTAAKEKVGDNSNTQYALLGLNAASEAGVPIKPEVWALSRQYWENAQRNDGGWNYYPEDAQSTSASMTCAGVSSLIITGLRRFQGNEVLVGDTVRRCGEGSFSPSLQRGLDWLGANFSVDQNVGRNQLWKYYYLYGLERAGRLAGVRYFGNNDWYRAGARELIHNQGKATGSWIGQEVYERTPTIATSFALLFLAKGRAGVIINKLKHEPRGDWQNDPDDVRNLVNLVSKDWKTLLTWQVVDADQAEVEDLMMAPILYMNGHKAPVLTPGAKAKLREYLEQGGFLLAEACCGDKEFDAGFKSLMAEILPEPEYALKPLPPEHAVWRARHELKPDIHPLMGVQHGCRTAVIYTPQDLSCFWHNAESQPDNPSVIKAMRVGQNIVDYATGRELPPDKLEPPKVAKFNLEKAKRGALQVAKIRHAGDWNVAPMAVPSLMSALRDELKFDVVLTHKALFPSDPNLVNFPLIYIHGRSPMAFGESDQAILRRHLKPGRGTLFADAACGSPAFDGAFRKFIAELLPDGKLEPIPPDDEIFTDKVGYDLSNVEYSQAAGGGKGRPQLEGVKIDGRWAVIYSKFDIGCAMERQSALDCKGYSHDSALKLAANIVIYSTLP